MISNIEMTQIDLNKDTNLSHIQNKRFLQTTFWADFKSLHGWQKQRFSISITIDDKIYEGELSVLVRKFARLFSIAYIPMGFDFILEEVLNVNYSQIIAEISTKLKSFLPKFTLCTRFDLPIEFSSPSERDEAIKKIKTKVQLNSKKNVSIKKTKTDIQPPDTVLLDITPDCDKLLENMKPKWRYNIHLAEKKGVIIKKGTIKDIDAFYKIYEETAQRDGIALHSKSYYESLLKLSDEYQSKKNAPLITLYIAQHEEDVLASIITIFTKTEAVYLYGASSNVKRNLMPAYLLQWNAIQDAKTFGSFYYDFYGIPPTDDENHPMHGLYRFKTGFGGKNIHRIGSIDVPLSFFYSVAIFAENLRAFYFKKLKKKLIGR